MIKQLIALIALMMSFLPNAFATEILVWDKKPLPVRLEVNQERLIEFPDNIEITMPPALYKRINISTAAGVAYITPRATFPKTRIQVTLIETNQLVYVDLFAVRESITNSSLGMVKIITNDEHLAKQALREEKFKKSGTVTAKELIQYASHDFFAPPRFKNLAKPVQESVIQRPLNLDLLFIGRSASLFDLKAIKQYRTTRYTLTAIHLTNRTNEKQMIVYSDFYPNFEHVSSQHTDVGPKGSISESTVVYLITKRPLTEDPTYSG
ncbi:TIGR03749 family integrating conjugative element protein [Enterovibrio norvegicus]|uniref:TIGR03749 family integrating conjugative element protein n=1 Tax=Enterovibrio norvegicus TaxID=188144 RepID=UPI000C85E783|nr:TIGR03749 family integrating conjugative element protein [Enterovibrio norvegicus]PMH64430.1 integrating conjugative element protein [Enterovibrio norvegicus]